MNNHLISEIGSYLSSGRLVLLDGAIGTELDRRGVDMSMPLWSARAIMDAPDILGQIHLDYLVSGAEVITANTFRTHRRNLDRAGLGDRAVELTEQAVAIAQKACSGTSSRAMVAGSMAPLEDCYSPDLVPTDECLQVEHTEMAHSLIKAGVDLLLIETMNTVREAVAATKAAVETGCPVLVSVICGSDGRLLSGETVSAASEALTPINPDAILINCAPAPDLHRPLAELRANTSLPVGAYGNVGYMHDDRNWVDSDASDPEIYALHAHRWRESGAMVIGGCCGTTPAHIARIKASLLDPFVFRDET